MTFQVIFLIWLAEQLKKDNCISATEISELQQRGWTQATGKEKETVFVQLLFLVEIYHEVVTLPQGEGCGRKQTAQQRRLAVLYPHSGQEFLLFSNAVLFPSCTHSFNHHRCLKR